jgi:hypothetical protein
MHSLLSVRDDEKAAAAAADHAAFGMFKAVSVSLQFSSPSSSSSSSSTMTPSSSFESSVISSSSDSTLLFPVSVSSAHALALFCVLASQVISSCVANTFEEKPLSH